MLSFTARGQNSADPAIQANIIYRFTKYVDWPSDKKTGEFILGVVSDNDLYIHLTALTANKFVGRQRIIVKKFSPAASSYDCHILFVSERESGNLKRIAHLTSRRSILLVSEDNRLIEKGSCINFIIMGERLRLEFGKNNIESRNLSIASELLDLGTIVN